MLALRAILAAAALPGTVALVVPWYLARGGGWSFEPGAWRWLGALLAIAGASGLVWCIVEFARRGRGTLAPIDPPRFVVRGGLYRFVRNPMYVCVLTLGLGEALLYGSGAVAAYVAVVAVVFHLFVIAYEAPTLRDTFGADYEAYVQRVPRWIPRRPR